MPCLGQVAVQRASCLCPGRSHPALSRWAASHVLAQSGCPFKRRIYSSTQEGPLGTTQQPADEVASLSTTQASSSSSGSSSSSSGGSSSSSRTGTKQSPSPVDREQQSDASQQPWLVERFEERRRREAEAAAAAAATGSLPASAAAGAAAEKGTSSSKGISGDAPSHQDNSTPSRQLTPGAVLQIAAQLLQLCVATAALILWPAALVPGGLHLPRIWALWGVYVAFFSLGSVARILRHGPLSPRSKDAQTRTWQGTAALVVFIAAMPVVHWGCVLRYCRLQPQAAGVTGCDLLAGLLVPGALLLHWAASRALGRAYDRVVRPEVLVTAGPYAWVQHPIYTSYMLLFAGCCLALHSVAGALAITGVCLLYYSLRCSLEQAVLLQAFGDRYASCAAATGRFLPRRTQLMSALLPGSS